MSLKSGDGNENEFTATTIASPVVTRSKRLREKSDPTVGRQQQLETKRPRRMPAEEEGSWTTAEEPVTVTITEPVTVTIADAAATLAAGAAALQQEQQQQPQDTATSALKGEEENNHLLSLVQDVEEAPKLLVAQKKDEPEHEVGPAKADAVVRQPQQQDEHAKAVPQSTASFASSDPTTRLPTHQPNNGGARWRAHQMVEDYVEFASNLLLYPTEELPGPFGVDHDDDNKTSRPLETISALGYLTAPFRRPTIIETWSPYEIGLFEAGLGRYGKDFRTISKKLMNESKSTKEIIDFYYVWKKTSHYVKWKQSYVPAHLDVSEEEYSDDEEDEGKPPPANDNNNNTQQQQQQQPSSDKNNSTNATKEENQNANTSNNNTETT